VSFSKTKSVTDLLVLHSDIYSSDKRETELLSGGGWSSTWSCCYDDDDDKPVIRGVSGIILKSLSTWATYRESTKLKNYKKQPYWAPHTYCRKC